MLMQIVSSYVPVLSGISPLQTFGETNKRYLPQVLDCKQACAAETTFTCTGFLWPAAGGDCYLYDKMNLALDIFRNNQNSYVMYVRVCDGAPTPSVGFCEFVQNLTNVAAVTSSISVSPGIAAESSCREFCIAQFQGVQCNAYVVSLDTKMLSQCVLYSTVPTGLTAGTSNLYVKTCRPPPVSCTYTPWSAWGTCTATCTKTRNRTVAAQATVGGAPCLTTEMTGSSSCTESPCVLTTSTAKPLTTTPNGSGNGGITPTSSGGTGGGTTTGGPPRDTPCAYTDWTGWGTCNSQCLQTSTRTPLTGSAAACSNTSSTNLSQVCSGGACTTGGNGGTGNGATTSAPVPETGCRFYDIDPQSKPSTLGFKAVGAQASCSSKCAAETSFKCEAYATTGPGGPCVLHGAVDSPTNVILMSSWYLQDLNCKVNKTAATSLCGWQKVRGNISAGGVTAKNWKSLGYAINSDHCGTLCMMNHPMFKPQPCGAYAFTYNVPWAGPQHNCFMYTPIENPYSFNSTGTYDLYKQVCFANSTSVATSRGTV
uniref:Uncharacterized protein n=1 Tax=Panagrolaimus davidi TaxID=227884 RepID=A0A914PMT4_9BILA